MGLGLRGGRTSPARSIEAAQSTDYRFFTLVSGHRWRDQRSQAIPRRREAATSNDKDAHDKLVDYLKHNAYRMDYERYRDRGYQIGSGAMESLHRTGSQARCKLPGCRWCVETSQAVFDARMLFLCGRWDKFWAQKDLTDQLVEVFNNRPPIAENQGGIVPLEEAS